MKKSDRDIMEILEAYDATGSAHSAAQLAGVDPKTVRRYVTARDAGLTLAGPTRRPRLIDDYLAKIEEWIDRSKGKVRADIVHERFDRARLRRHRTHHPPGCGGGEGSVAGRASSHLPAWGHLPRSGGGSPNPACGCSSIGAQDRKYPAPTGSCAQPCCSVPGWHGHATAS